MKVNTIYNLTELVSCNVLVMNSAALSAKIHLRLIAENYEV